MKTSFKVYLIDCEIDITAEGLNPTAVQQFKEDIEDKEKKESLKQDSNPKEKDAERKETDKNRLKRQLSSLKDEGRLAEQEIAELERQLR